MDLLNWVRKEITLRLWNNFKNENPSVLAIEQKLAERGEKVVADHLAIIDIPGQNSGVNTLSEIFELIGFLKRGSHYLPEKQNNFSWFAEPGIEKKDFHEALPQIIVSDFRLDDLSVPTRSLVNKYAEQASPAPIALIKSLLNRCNLNDEAAAHELIEVIIGYLNERSFPLPTKKDFDLLRHENELLAWTMIFSKKVNHFAIAGHALKTLGSITELNDFIVSHCNLNLNYQGGSSIKGGLEKGIAQSAIVAERTVIALSDGPVILPAMYLEFAWRFPQIKSVNRPLLWSDYFTGFVTQSASQVIESVYSNSSHSS
jgi:hypothetical protein